MILHYYIEVQDKTEQVKMERALYSAQAPFIDAGKVSDLPLEEFEKFNASLPEIIAKKIYEWDRKGHGLAGRSEGIILEWSDIVRGIINPQ